MTMNDLKTLLREADPLRDQQDASLSPDEAQALRRAMLAAARESTATISIWHRPLALAAIAIVVIGIGGLTGHSRRDQTETTGATGATSLGIAGGSSGEIGRRQVQFSTPGGTRIIWVLDPNANFQESMP